MVCTDIEALILLRFKIPVSSDLNVAIMTKLMTLVFINNAATLEVSHSDILAYNILQGYFHFQ